MQIVIDIPDNVFKRLVAGEVKYGGITARNIFNLVKKGTPLTPNMLADELMEERIRGKLNSDTTFEKDIIRDVKCRLTVSIKDYRPCYCGAELKEVWRESEVEK